ncbi:MAG: hypothetical protein WCO84_03615 [bacterium]
MLFHFTTGNEVDAAPVVEAIRRRRYLKDIDEMDQHDKVAYLLVSLHELNVPLRKLYPEIEKILGRKFFTSELTYKRIKFLVRELLEVYHISTTTHKKRTKELLPWLVMTTDEQPQQVELSASN